MAGNIQQDCCTSCATGTQTSCGRLAAASLLVVGFVPVRVKLTPRLQHQQAGQQSAARSRHLSMSSMIICNNAPKRQHLAQTLQCAHAAANTTAPNMSPTRPPKHPKHLPLAAPFTLAPTPSVTQQPTTLPPLRTTPPAPPPSPSPPPNPRQPPHTASPPKAHAHSPIS